MTVKTGSRHHLVTARVENKAGVLLRVAGLFSRRGYNIISLAVAPTDDPDFSRISIVVDVESNLLQQVIEQLDKLINVVEITELDPERANKAELLLGTVDVNCDGSAGLRSLIEDFGAIVVEQSAVATTLRLVAEPSVLDDFEQKLRSYGISELQRTGAVALPKLSSSK
jgi:acetolactate synthase-1/3 small subunit